MEAKETTNLTTKKAFINARKDIQFLVKNAEAYNFKYATLEDVQKEVKRVCDKYELSFITSFMETSTNSYTTGKGKLQHVSYGLKTITIFSSWDDIEIESNHSATWSADKPEDATYGASTSGERYLLMRVFGIPTYDEDKARKEDKEKREKALKEKQSQPIANSELKDTYTRIVELGKQHDFLKTIVKSKIDETGVKPNEWDLETSKEVLKTMLSELDKTKKEVDNEIGIGEF